MTDRFEPPDRLPESLAEEVDEDRLRLDALARGDGLLLGQLDAITTMVQHLVLGCTGASLGLVLQGRPRTVAATARVALEVDLVQYRTRQGPCLDAIEGGGKVVRVDLLQARGRYERFAPGALDLDVKAVLSMPLRWHDEVIGSLNLYARNPDALPSDPPEALVVGAALAAAAVAGSPVFGAARELVADLTDLLEADVIVDQAVGYLMVARSCSAAAAADLLRLVADARGGDLHAAAGQVLERLVAELGGEPPAG